MNRLVWWRAPQAGTEQGSSAEHSPAAFCLHGFAQNTEAWHQVFSHAPATTLLCAVRLPGHGLDADFSESSFEAVVDALAADIEASGQAPAHLVGYSLGGRLCLLMALRHAHLFHKVSLLSAHPGLADAEARSTRRRDDARWSDLLRTHGMEEFVQAWEQQPIFATQQHRLDSAAHQEQRRTRLAHRPRPLAHALDALGLGAMPSCTEHLPSLSMPCQLVTGALDAKFGGLAANMVRHNPGLTHCVIPEVGHNLLLEAPVCVAQLLWGGPPVSGIVRRV